MAGCLGVTSGPSEPTVSPAPCTLEAVDLGGSGPLTSFQKLSSMNLPSVNRVHARPAAPSSRAPAGDFQDGTTL